MENPVKKGKDKIVKNVDKLVMGAIIGGAVGSVIGAKYGKSKSPEAPKPKKPSLIKRLLRKIFNVKKEDKK